MNKKERLTLEQAKRLQCGDILESKLFNNADGTPMRWKVNGKIKTWKRDSSRIKVPVKRGLYEYGYITEYELKDFKPQD